MSKLKAREVALDHIQGMSILELSQKYRVSPNVVRMRIERGAFGKIIEQHSQQVLDELVPKALAVFDLALDAKPGSVTKHAVEVATRVLAGSGVLKRELYQVPESAPGEVTTIEEYRALRVTRQSSELAGPPAEDQCHEPCNSRDGWPTVLDTSETDAGWTVLRHVPELQGHPECDCADPAASDPQDR